MSEETKFQSLVQINDRFITKSPPALTRLDKKVHVSVRVLVELVRKLQNKRWFLIVIKLQPFWSAYTFFRFFLQNKLIRTS